MSKGYLPADLREQLLAADDQRCVYCHTTEANTGQPMTVDHIVPEGQGGPTAFDNLCYACRRCNEFKGSATAAGDPLTEEIVPLFHPRTQTWSNRFAWDASRTHVIGLTAIGRTTVVALNMNNAVIVDARRRWVSAGWQPPWASLDKVVPNMYNWNRIISPPLPWQRWAMTSRGLHSQPPATFRAPHD